MREPYVRDSDFTLWHGDAVSVLYDLPANSIDCCVTSPPYFGLRDYGSPGQVGLEATPNEYVARLVNIFREVRRVLTPAGTLWLNLGDSYYAAGWESRRRNEVGAGSFAPEDRRSHTGIVDGLKVKDLVGIPWRVAFALQSEGWYLRSDIIWSKPNPMPESVTDRPTKAHEYVFLLSKSARYWFDQEAVREPYQESTFERYRYGGSFNGGDKHADDGSHWGDQFAADRKPAKLNQPPPGGPRAETLDGSQGELPRGPDGRRKTQVVAGAFSEQHRDGERWPNGGRNIRSVWEIPTQPYPEAHFAVFPEELPRRCILAGCPEWVCGTCGKARVRILEREQFGKAFSATKYDHTAQAGPLSRSRQAYRAAGLESAPAPRMLGWSDCGHNDYRPGVVLDPFGGSGTTALVARKHNRRSVLIELNEDYCRLAASRLQQLSLLAEPA